MTQSQAHEQAQARRAPTDTILVGFDGTDLGVHALEAAARLAARLGLTLVVAHVLPAANPLAEGAYTEELRNDLELQVMTQATRVVDELGVSWRLAIAEGDPACGLLRLAEQHAAALVVVGTRGRGARPAMHRLVSGSVSGHLVHHETRPVLVVPTPRPA
jgi:nucleotide-binding universal stress UspA family protein